MADADPEWLLWAKRQKDHTQTLAERVQGQSNIIDELLQLREQVKELQPLAERVYAQSRMINELLPIRKQVKQLQHEVESLQKSLSSAQQAEIDEPTIAERVRSRSNSPYTHQQQLKALQHEIKSLRKNLSSAQQAEKDARAQYEININKADLRIIKLAAEKKALAKEVEQCRAQTDKIVTDMQQQNQDANTLLNREIAHLRMKYEQQTKELSTLRIDHQKSLSALEERNKAVNNRQVGVQMVNLTTQALGGFTCSRRSLRSINIVSYLESNTTNSTRSSGFTPTVQRFLDSPPLRRRDWSEQERQRSPIDNDDEEIRDINEEHEQSLSVPMTEASTLSSCTHIEEPITKENKAKTPLIRPSAVVLEPQGNRFLDEYVTYSEDSIPPQLLTYEAKIVEAFVSGLRQEEQRVAMRRRLDEKGWTWKMAFEEISRVLREGYVGPATRTMKLQQSAASQPRTADGRFAKRKRRT